MAIAWQFEDETTADTDAAMRRAIAGGAVVPAIWRLEVANVLRMAVRRQRFSEQFFDAAIDRLGELPIHEDQETSRHAWSATSDFARNERLTLYDAAYLELAVRKRLPLATCDRELAAAAKRHGLEVLTA